MTYEERPFLVFAGHIHFPAGGAEDFYGRRATAEQARGAADFWVEAHGERWAEVAIIVEDEMQILYSVDSRHAPVEQRHDEHQSTPPPDADAGR